MESDLSAVVSKFRELEGPRRVSPDNPFLLACTLASPATDDDVSEAWEQGTLPAQVRELWLVSKEARLFEDVEYGQWGLVMMPPGEALRSTEEARKSRPTEFQPTDVVLGKFLGDSELLVVTSAGSVLIALPLDPRKDWYLAARTLSEFLEQYRESLGFKFWE